MLLSRIRLISSRYSSISCWRVVILALDRPYDNNDIIYDDDNNEYDI